MMRVQYLILIYLLQLLFYVIKVSTQIQGDWNQLMEELGTEGEISEEAFLTRVDDAFQQACLETIIVVLDGNVANAVPIIS